MDPRILERCWILQRQVREFKVLICETTKVADSDMLLQSVQFSQQRLFKCLNIKTENLYLFLISPASLFF